MMWLIDVFLIVFGHQCSNVAQRNKLYQAFSIARKNIITDFANKVVIFGNKVDRPKQCKNRVYYRVRKDEEVTACRHTSVVY